MKKSLSAVSGLFLLAILLSAFELSFKDEPPQIADTTMFRKPANFPALSPAPKVTARGFELGKALFYDPALSVNGTVSCGNCHQQSAAFANVNSALSTGVNNCKGTRSAPPLFNLAWQKTFMWDGRINELNQVPVNALTNPCEMGDNLPAIIAKLQASKTYPQFFEQVFGSGRITEDKLLNALGQFMSMMISANSKYDRAMRREAGAVFTDDEKSGYGLFKTNCAACHKEPLFTDGSYRNNGLDLTSADVGRDSLTHLAADLGKFKVPSLRNVEISAPYMHDGRFRNLKAVLQHYATDVKNHPNLDPQFRSNGKLGLALTSQAQAQIIAFLKTLTDIDYINDRRFNNN